MTENETKVSGGELVEVGKSDPLTAMQQGEILFERRLALAIKATKSADWMSQGDKPYLIESGAQKIATRFGICINGLEIERENLEDEKGRYYVYTVTGLATWPATGRSIQEIGVCTSRDAFFGKGKAVEDVDLGNIKKAAVTNFMGRAILKILGLGGLSWDDLAKYEITRTGKAGVKYDGGASRAAATKKADQAEAGSKKPFWTSDYNGKSYLFARVGNHFSAEFLTNLGFTTGKKEGTMFRAGSTETETALADEFQAAEEALEGKDGTAS